MDLDQDLRPAAAGDNFPPSPTIPERLSEAYADIIADIDAIAGRANRAPKEVKTKDDFDAVGEIVKAATAAFKRADKARETEKAPFLKAGTEVDGWFRTPKDRMSCIIEALTERANAYNKRIAAEQRAKAEAEMRRAREEENRRLEAARKAEEDNRLADAAKHTAAAEVAAEKAEAATIKATASVEEITKTTSAAGVKSAAKTVWKHEIQDYAKLDVNAIKPYLKREAVDDAIKMAVKLGLRELSGVKIYEDTETKFR